MCKKLIYVDSYFNIKQWKQNIDERLTKDWIEYRVGVFMKYTLKCLKAQTNQDFIARIRYLDSTENIVKEVLDEYDKMPDNIKFVKEKEYEEDIKKLIQGYDYLYMLKLDSDDMYHKNYIQQMYDYKINEKTEIILNPNGYLYDARRNYIVNVSFPASNYYTEVYKKEEYLSRKRYNKIYSFKDLFKFYNVETIEKRNFIRVIHSKNTETKYDISLSKNTIKKPEEVKQVLSEFIGDYEL